jgi:hypothetical protein
VPWLEADHSPPSSAEINNECIYTSILPSRHGVCTKDQYDTFLTGTILTSHGGLDELKQRISANSTNAWVKNNIPCIKCETV